MASQLGCTESHAKAKLTELPLPFREQFNCNATNPIRFLGFVLAAHANPSILIYETSGMDPNGRKLLHEYASRVFTKGTLIHASSVPIDLCERPGDCKILDF
jgi:hypothetical protein